MLLKALFCLSRMAEISEENLVVMVSNCFVKVPTISFSWVLRAEVASFLTSEISRVAY